MVLARWDRCKMAHYGSFQAMMVNAIGVADPAAAGPSNAVETTPPAQRRGRPPGARDATPRTRACKSRASAGEGPTPVSRKLSRLAAKATQETQEPAPSPTAAAAAWQALDDPDAHVQPAAPGRCHRTQTAHAALFESDSEEEDAGAAATEVAADGADAGEEHED